MHIELLRNHITIDDMLYYNHIHYGWYVLGNDCIRIEWETGFASTFVIFHGPFTLNEMCRDCGNHYELSTGGKEYFINKISLALYQILTF